MQPDLGSLVIISAIAVAAPLIADLPRRFRVSVVVVEILLGIIVGPDVLDFAATDPYIDFLSNIGLAALFFLAGTELDLRAVRGAPLAIAGWGWLLSFGLALGFAGILNATGVTDDTIIVAIALATTTLGVLVPVLRDAGLRGTPFGTMTMAVGTVGELGPIVLVSVVLAVGVSSVTEAALLGVFIAVAIVLAITAPRIRSPRIERVIHETMHASGQLAIRICLFLLVAMVFLSVELGLELVLGALAAGIVVGIALREVRDSEVVRIKLDAIAYGLLVPIFFVRSGLTFDLDGLLDSSGALAQLPIFLVLFLVVRGLPALLAAGQVSRRGIVPLALLSATTLPLVVAITQEGVSEGDLTSPTAAAMVGAAMLTVLIFPALALAFLGRAPARKAPLDEGPL